MISKIRWNPDTRWFDKDKRFLVAAPGGVFIGHVDEWEGKRCFISESRYVVHSVSAWADLPTVSTHGASASSEVNLMPDATTS